jgi:inosine triphosphate pyrophosphatase
LGAYSYQQNPENKYLLFHAEPGWKTLELIWGYDAEHRQKLFDAAAGLFSQACLYSDPREKVVTCYDLVIPDPGVADLLASVRVLTIDISAESPKKKLKTSGREMIPTIAFVTKEAKHFNEVMRMLKPDVIDDAEKPQLEYRLEAVDIGLVAIEGDFIEIAKSQCIAAARKTGSAVVTEVTGLCFTALNGLPGPYTTPFLNSCGVERLQQMVAAFDDKTAYAKTVVCFSPGADSECDPVFFDGRTRGCVVSPRGENGCSFEFDTIFQPDKGNGKTYAEMSPEEKDSISHRGRAYRQLQNYFQKFRKEIASKL